MSKRTRRPMICHGVLCVLAATFLSLTGRLAFAQDGAFVRRAAPTPAASAASGEVAAPSTTETPPILPGTPQLEPIVLTPIIQYSSVNTAGGFSPIIQGQAEGTFVGTDGGNGLSGQFGLTLKPTPSTSSTSDVAQQVKINSGLATASGGLRLHIFPAGWNPPGHGNIGLDARIQVQAAYQRTQTTDPTSGQIVTSDFGLLVPEAVVGVWLRFAYLGYSFSRFWTFGGTIPSDLDGLINAQNVERILLVIPIEVQNQTTGQPKTFYFEPTYVADSTNFRHGSLVLSVGASFSPL